MAASKLYSSVIKKFRTSTEELPTKVYFSTSNDFLKALSEYL